MNLRERMARVFGGWQMGDVVEKALTHVGITKQRVEEWLGGPCGCAERQAKWNSLSLWAARVAAGKDQRALEYLETLMQDEAEHAKHQKVVRG